MRDFRLTIFFRAINVAVMNNATRIIDDLFGGTRKAARAMNKKASTIQSWKKAGIIPAKHQPDVLAAGKAEGINISPSDFFEPA